MMFCDQCGMKLEEGTLFCPECGNKISAEEAVSEVVTPVEEPVMQEAIRQEEAQEAIAEEAITEETITEEANQEAGALVDASTLRYCHNCGAANSDKDAFCYACGTAFTKEKSKKTKKSFAPMIKKIAVLVIALAAVAAIVILAVNLLKGMGKKENLIYLKDNEITSLKKDEPYAISEDAFASESDVYGPYSVLSGYVTVSEDGKYVYYPQDYEDGYFDLYCKKLGSEDAEDVKIASEVHSYYILKNGKIVYIKDNASRKLYIGDAENAEKAATDVISYKVSEDEKMILWYSDTEEDAQDIYVCDIALKEKEIKLDDEVSSVIYISDDLKQVVYMKDDTLYCISDYEDRKKIDSKVISAFCCVNGDKTEIYYQKDTGDGEYYYMDVIDDDLEAKDAKIERPNEYDYDTYSAYYDAWEEYDEKQIRDNLRERWAGYYLAGTSRGIYRYVLGEDEEQEIIKENAIGCYTGYRDSAFLCVMVNEEKLEKVAFSKLAKMDSEKASEKIEETFEEAKELYLIQNGEMKLLSDEYKEYGNSISYYGENKDNYCYFTVEKYTDEDGYETTILKTDASKKEGEIEVVADEVSTVEFISDEGIYYMTDVKDGEGDLYLDDERIESDVKTYSVRQMTNGNGILYCTDPEKDENVATLNLFKDGKAVEIDDDVTTYDYNEAGKIVYLKDYNFKKYRGDLMMYEKGESVKLDEDVTSILYFY